MVDRVLDSSALRAESLTESALPWKYLITVRNKKDYRDERSPYTELTLCPLRLVGKIAPRRILPDLCLASMYRHQLRGM